MESFQAIRPSALLAPYVKQYWFITVDDTVMRSQRFIPAGCMGLAFNRNGNIYSSLEKGFLPTSYLFGQSTNHATLTFNTLSLIIVVFQPVGTKVFFRNSMNELNEKTVAIKDLSDPQLKELELRLMDTVDNQVCAFLIEQFLLNRMKFVKDENFKRIGDVMLSIDAGITDISTLANRTCLGYKQFKRIFATYIGTNPKDYLRITRFQKTMQMLYIHPQTNLNELACSCGYYDLSHFIKEFKEFSGYLPSEFLSVREPYSESYSLFRSCFLEIKQYNQL
jgi:AraC-like DNA-binding protein